MSSMNSYVPLDPQARPVDQFRQADVAAPAPTNPALQLAASLREFNPRLQGVLDRQFSAYRRASELRATKDVLTKRLDNMASFKKAVDAGEIPWADNPWSMAQAEQEVAKAEARKLALGFDKILEENPEVRFGNDPDAVSNLFDQHFSGFAQNLSPFAAEAAVPELDSMKSRIMGQWSNQRSRERAAEREESFKDAVSSLFSAGSKFDSEESSIAQAQSLLDGALRTVDPLTANQWLYSSLKDAAIQKGDAGLPARVLAKLKGNGGASLVNTAAARDLQRDVSLSVSSETIRKIREASAIQKERAEAWKTGVTDLALAEVAANPAKSIRDFKIPKEVLDAAPPGAKAEWIKESLALDSSISAAQSRDEADAGRALLTQATAAIEAGESPTRVFGRLLPQAVAFKADSELRTLVNTYRDELSKSPDAISRRSVITQMDMANELTPALVEHFVNEGLIPDWEAEHWLAKAATIKSDPLVGEALRTAERQIRAFWVQKKPNKIVASITGDLTNAEAEDAVFRVNDEFLRWKISANNVVKGSDAYAKLQEITKRVLSEAPSDPADSASTLPNETRPKGKK